MGICMEELKVKEIIRDAILKEEAHASLSKAVENISLETVGKRVEGIPYTIWQLIEHIRITQWDIVEFSSNPLHQSPRWPEGYWPEIPAPENQEHLDQSVRKIEHDILKLLRLLENDDLTKPFDHGNGQTLLRELMLVLSHSSYHIGQIILMRRILGKWEKTDFITL
jgi:uncharacterized damage-inducible protein DinB